MNLAIIQARNKEAWDQTGCSGDSDKGYDAGHILMIELMKFANSLDVACETTGQPA